MTAFIIALSLRGTLVVAQPCGTPRNLVSAILTPTPHPTTKTPLFADRTPLGYYDTPFRLPQCHLRKLRRPQASFVLAPRKKGYSDPILTVPH